MFKNLIFNLKKREKKKKITTGGEKKKGKRLKKKKGKAAELQKITLEAEVYNSKKKCDKKKKLKSIIRFHSAVKIDNYNRG